jgi:hypothetical protein
MNIDVDKIGLYRTAYSPVHEAWVTIQHRHRDSKGEWILSGKVHGHSVRGWPYDHVLFRVYELDRFCL